MKRYVPVLERTRPPYSAPTIGDYYQLNAYIDSHPVTGCLLAEAVCYPDNVKKSGYINKGCEQLAFASTPKTRCDACPFDQCYSTITEDNGYISQYRINLFRQALKEQTIIPAQPSLIPEEVI
jgi:hypothetical protein